MTHPTIVENQTISVAKKEYSNPQQAQTSQPQTTFGIDNYEWLEIANNGSLFTLIIMITIGWYTSKLFGKYISDLITMINKSIQRTDEAIEILDGLKVKNEREVELLKELLSEVRRDKK